MERTAMEDYTKRDLELGLSFLTASQRTRRTRFGLTTEELIALLLEKKTQSVVVQQLGLHPSNGSVTDEIEKVTGWKLKQSSGKNVSEKLINLWYQMKDKKDKSTDSKKQFSDAILQQEIKQAKVLNFSGNTTDNSVDYAGIEEWVSALNPASKGFVKFLLGK